MLDILFLILGFELSFANGIQSMYEPPEIEEIKIEDTYYVSFNIQAYIYEYFYLKGSVKIPVYFKIDEFWPVALSSFIEVGVLLNGLSVGWRHFCTHPIAPFYGEQTFTKFYDEAGSELFIRYETKKIGVL